jgi:predicted enzyme related to lactoylglutathione lyase
MLNLRVADMESAIAHCQAAGIAVITNPEWDTEETGKFARINDPDGNPIELWQPPAEP